jgi:hydrogenase maturation protein HypF
VTRERLQVRVLGVVQGVGFRPTVHRLATSLELTGFVRNDPQGVTLEVEGERGRLLEFLSELPRQKPPAAILYAVDHRFVEPLGSSRFEIVASEATGESRAWLLPDLGICDACRAELLDPSDRRYRYPFLNCTHCGPRFTIIDSLPYDRPRTSMRDFVMCERCRREYENPRDRRFHAQPTACADCGPQLELVRADARITGEDALRAAVDAIGRGGIVAVKGLGGYHIVVDAANEAAIVELRRRKRRPFKPLAVMYADLAGVRRHVQTGDLAETLLSGMQSPIVLLPRTKAGWEEIAPSVAVRSPHLGVFLAYTPLHVLLLSDLGRPVVATSGNRTDEPTLHRDEDAGRDLAGICDAFLVHDRPILRQADDSVLQVLRKPQPKPQALRRARGFTPLPVLAPRELPPILALGGQMNAVFALSRGREVILSQHLGDLGSHASQESYRRTLEDFLRIYSVRPERIVHDLHPDYYTTSLAETLSAPALAVQHHHAHLAACLLENRVEGEVLGLTFDGTGYGLDGTVWGGELLWGDARDFERVGSLQPFRLPGGEAAVHETWRTGLALLWEAYGEEIPAELPLLRQVPAGRVAAVRQLLDKDVRSPATTSAGRLFDGVAAILGISLENRHQAQSPQMLEAAAWRHEGRAETWDMPLTQDGLLRLDWRPLVRQLVAGVQSDQTPEALAAAFHRSLAAAAVAAIEWLGADRVALTGGVFCNRYLTEALVTGLAALGREAWVHSQLPPTDGSLAAGQLWIAAHREG